MTFKWGTLLRLPEDHGTVDLNFRGQGLLSVAADDRVFLLARNLPHWTQLTKTSWRSRRDQGCSPSQVSSKLDQQWGQFKSATQRRQQPASFVRCNTKAQPTGPNFQGNMFHDSLSNIYSPYTCILVNLLQNICGIPLVSSKESVPET